MSWRPQMQQQGAKFVAMLGPVISLRSTCTGHQYFNCKAATSGQVLNTIATACDGPFLLLKQWFSGLQCCPLRLLLCLGQQPTLFALLLALAVPVHQELCAAAKQQR